MHPFEPLIPNPTQHDEKGGYTTSWEQNSKARSKPCSIGNRVSSLLYDEGGPTFSIKLRLCAR